LTDTQLKSARCAAAEHGCPSIYTERSMPRDEHVARLAGGAAAWNAWRMGQGEGPDLSGARLRSRGLSGFNLRGADLRGADLRGAIGRAGDRTGAHLDGANLFKAALDGADLAGAFLGGAQFLNCAQLVLTRNWQSAFRDAALSCGATIPDPPA